MIESMSPFEIILILAAGGFLLLAAEVFVPGLVLGCLGGIALIAAVAVAYSSYGIMTGSMVFAAIIVLSIIGFLVWMALFPHTSMGRQIMLQKAPAPDEKPPALLGLKGKALTPLRPSGTAVIEGRKLDVVSEGELIDAGEEIVVVREDAFRVLVRKEAARVVTSTDAR